MYDAQAQAKGYVFGDQAEQPALLGGDAATFAPEETDDFCGEKLRWCGEVIPSPSRAKRHRAGWAWGCVYCAPLLSRLVPHRVLLRAEPDDACR